MEYMGSLIVVKHGAVSYTLTKREVETLNGVRMSAKYAL